MKKYLVTLKSGVIMEVTNRTDMDNPIGLWRWALRQMTPQVLGFKECSILATEISVISPLEEEIFNVQEEQEDENLVY